MLGRLVHTARKITMATGFSRLGPPVKSRIHNWSEEKPDLSSHVAVITGATGETGRVIAKSLAERGAAVWLIDTSESAIEKTVQAIRSATGNEHVEGHGADMEEFSSVRNLSDDIHATTDHVDILVHNAGSRHDQWTTTTSGVEVTLASHVLGPYILTRRLEDRFSPGARILFMASGGLFTPEFDLSGLEMPARNYNGRLAHSRASRAQVVLARRLGEDYRNRFIVHAMHPGWSGSNSHNGRLHRLTTPLQRSPEQAADTMVWLATAQEPALSSGAFWHDRTRRSPAYIPRSMTDPRDESRLIPWIEARIRKAER
ncbi:MAG: SDR family NAD(P)-dependent oxidoreductase [Acidimicrobiia bacterium]|nr:SDR family NAD(P)-dependent oxidoreductase [Acidimicrobiia bacterium]